MTSIRPLVLAALLAVGFEAHRAEANWLTSLGEIAATTGKVAGKTGRLAGEMSAGLEGAVKAIARLPAEGQAGAIAAEALDGGAWRLRNAAGETITATSAESVRGALAGLTGDAKTLTLFVDQDTAFAAREAIAALPADAKLHLALDDLSLPLLRQGTGDGTRLYAELNQGVILALQDRALFSEALWQLQRPLGKAGMRVLSLDGGGPRALATVGRRSAEGMPVAEAIDPGALASALPSLRGQTVIVTGKVEGETLAFAGISGTEGKVAVADLMAAAERSDVNILVLDAGVAKQPGGTTWLWQERGIANLDSAMAKASLGDFIAALSRGQGRLAVDADWGASGHFRLSAKPAAAAAPAASGEIAAKTLSESTLELAIDLAGKVAGNVAPQTTTAALNSRDTQWDLDSRLIPGIPALLQYQLLGNWVLGLIGFHEARRWWAFLQRRVAGIVPPFTWPVRIGSELLYWLIFAPLIGSLAFIVTVFRILIGQVMDLVRIVTWPFRRLSRT
jgi:hypothetical protein